MGHSFSLLKCISFPVHILSDDNRQEQASDSEIYTVGGKLYAWNSMPENWDKPLFNPNQTLLYFQRISSPANNLS